MLGTSHDDPWAGRDAARRARYRDYLAFYEGDQWLGRPLPGERRLTINYARTLVRKCVSYLFPEPVTFAVIPEGSDDAAQGRARHAEEALARVYAENDLATVDFNAAIDAAVLGDGAFKVVWDEAARRPVVTAVDVQGLSVWWEADAPRRVTRIVQRTVTPGADGDAATTMIEEWTVDTFRLTVDGTAVRDGPNPFGWLPYVIFANAPQPQEFWGESDLVDLIAPARELNRRMSGVARVLDLSGNPIAVLENIEGAEGIQVGPGARWELPEGARAYLLDLLGGGGVGLHLQYIDLLYPSSTTSRRRRAAPSATAGGPSRARRWRWRSSRSSRRYGASGASGTGSSPAATP